MGLVEQQLVHTSTALSLNVQEPFMTLHHKMSRNVADGHFHVFIVSECKFYAIYNGEKYF